MRIVLTFWLLMGAVIIQDASAQDPGRFTRWAARDAGAFIKTVGPRLPLYTAAGSAMLLPGHNLDQGGLDRVQAGYEGTWRDYLDITNELGGPMVVIPLVALFEVSLFTGNEKFQDAAFTSLQAWVFNGFLTGALKQIFGRYRPETGSAPNHIRPFSGNTSFPSGHTSAAFAIITPWVYYYPNVATYGLFALAASTGVARIALDKHWPTDIVAGALVGYLTGRWLAKRHLGGPAASGGPSLVPVVGADAAGVQLNLRF